MSSTALVLNENFTGMLTAALRRVSRLKTDEKRNISKHIALSWNKCATHAFSRPSSFTCPSVELYFLLIKHHFSIPIWETDICFTKSNSPLHVVPTYLDLTVFKNRHILPLRNIYHGFIIQSIWVFDTAMYFLFSNQQKCL